VPLDYRLGGKTCVGKKVDASGTRLSRKRGIVAKERLCRTRVRNSQKKKREEGKRERKRGTPPRGGGQPMQRKEWRNNNKNTPKRKKQTFWGSLQMGKKLLTPGEKQGGGGGVQKEAQSSREASAKKKRAKTGSPGEGSYNTGTDSASRRPGRGGTILKALSYTGGGDKQPAGQY